MLIPANLYDSMHHAVVINCRINTVVQTFQSFSLFQKFKARPLKKQKTCRKVAVEPIQPQILLECEF